MRVKAESFFVAGDPGRGSGATPAATPGPRDCIYGQAVGDALGVPYEFRARGSFTCTGMTDHGTHDQPAGTWSDDTSMALAICDSYRELGRIDTDDIRMRFRRWYEEGTYTVDGLFDAGGTCARAIREGHGMAGGRDNGNGSLMRTLPLAFTPATDEEVRAVSAVTHAHPLSCGLCVGLVHVARCLMAGASPTEAAGEYARLRERPRHEVRSGGFVRDTFEAALWCLLTTSSYEECVLAAVNLGDDTDTTAAVAGGLAGIAYGEAAIPAGWLATLRGRDVIERCLF